METLVLCVRPKDNLVNKTVYVTVCFKSLSGSNLRKELNILALISEFCCLKMTLFILSSCQDCLHILHRIWDRQCVCVIKTHVNINTNKMYMLYWGHAVYHANFGLSSNIEYKCIYVYFVYMFGRTYVWVLNTGVKF